MIISENIIQLEQPFSGKMLIRLSCLAMNRQRRIVVDQLMRKQKAEIAAELRKHLVKSCQSNVLFITQPVQVGPDVGFRYVVGAWVMSIDRTLILEIVK